MAVVHEAIEDGIGDGSVPEVTVPLVDRELAGDERRLSVIAIVEDFEQVADVLVGERGEAEVVDDEELRLGQLPIERRALLHCSVAGEFLDEPWEAEATNGEVGAASRVRERRGDEAFADAGGSGDQDIQVLADPAKIGELTELTGIEAAGGTGIEVFEASLNREFGPPQPLREPGVAAFEDFLLDHQSEPVLEALALGVGGGELLFERGGHAAESQGGQLFDQRFSQHRWFSFMVNALSLEVLGPTQVVMHEIQGLGLCRRRWRLDQGAERTVAVAL